MIRVERLTKRFGAHTVIAEVSFAVETGQLVALLGPSGSGKSTLLRCLCGLERFDEGSVAIQGGRAGLVFQSHELFPHLSALDNCTLAPMRVSGLRRRDAAQRALGLLRQLGLESHAHAFPDRLSGGQRQRVAIARALAMEPKVLLYDEPTSALDRALRREVVATLSDVRKTGVTQLVVTHDPWLARFADAVMVFDSGRIVEQGSPDLVLVRPQHATTQRLIEQQDAQ